MRDQDIGDVVVTDGPTMAGLVTDRDIVVRAIAERCDPASTTIGEIVTHDLIMVEQTTRPGGGAAMRERGGPPGAGLRRRQGRRHRRRSVTWPSEIDPELGRRRDQQGRSTTIQTERSPGVGSEP